MAVGQPIALKERVHVHACGECADVFVKTASFASPTAVTLGLLIPNHQYPPPAITVPYNACHLRLGGGTILRTPQSLSTSPGMFAGLTTLS